MRTFEEVPGDNSLAMAPWDASRIRYRHNEYSFCYASDFQQKGLCVLNMLQNFHSSNDIKITIRKR